MKISPGKLKTFSIEDLGKGEGYVSLSGTNFWRIISLHFSCFRVNMAYSILGFRHHFWVVFHSLKTVPEEMAETQARPPFHWFFTCIFYV
jgi:hypothetical protein